MSEVKLYLHAEGEALKALESVGMGSDEVTVNEILSGSITVEKGYVKCVITDFTVKGDRVHVNSLKYYIEDKCLIIIEDGVKYYTYPNYYISDKFPFPSEYFNVRDGKRALIVDSFKMCDFVTDSYGKNIPSIYV